MAGLLPPGGASVDPSAADPLASGGDPGTPSAPAAPPAPDPDSDTSNPANQTLAGPAAQSVNGADATGGPRAVGTLQDANDAIQQQDPTAPQSVTPEEQAEYDQFKSRFQLIISDNTPPPHGQPGKTLHETIIGELNNPKVPLATTVGTVTAQIAMMIVHTATIQKITYQPDVLMHVAQECVAITYLAGLSAGIFKGVPAFHGINADGSYDFSQQEVRIIADSQMQAMRVFGSMELKMGMISPDVQKANMDFWHQQVAREVQTGKVNEQVLQHIAASGALNHVQSGLSGMVGGGGGPQGSQGASPSAGTDPSAATGTSASPAPPTGTAGAAPTDPSAGATDPSVAPAPGGATGLMPSAPDPTAGAPPPPDPTAGATPPPPGAS